MSNIDKDIEIVKEELNNWKKRFGIEGSVAINAQSISNVLSELETYKKIVEKLAFKVNELDISGSCHLLLPKDWDCKKYKNCEQCVIDWARKEVEKDE